MSFLATYNSALQVIAAFLIFAAAGYLAPLLSIMTCLALAIFILEGTRYARTYLVTVPLQGLRFLLLRGNKT
jgi:hypothetical protein